MRHPVLAAALAAALLSSCGYIGDPLPPLANVPVRVTDLAAIQRGPRIIAQFTIPQLTTEGQPIPRPLTLDLRAGTWSGANFDEGAWAAGAKHVVTPDFTSPTATYEIPSAEWTGKETILAVRVTAANGKQSGWSNFVIVPVVPAPAVPEGVTPAGTARGVQVTWRASGPRFRVLRKGEGGEYAVVATVEEPQWLDQTAELGGKYTYLVQTLVPLEGGRLAESELSAPAAFTYEDRFAPAAPAGLRATAAPQSIELTWDRNGEADLAGYRVYRAVGDGAMERVAELAQIPSYSDRAIEPGKTYRYAVAAFDRAGNESQHSAEARATAEVR